MKKLLINFDDEATEIIEAYKRDGRTATYIVNMAVKAFPEVYAKHIVQPSVPIFDQDGNSKGADFEEFANKGLGNRVVEDKPKKFGMIGRRTFNTARGDIEAPAGVTTADQLPPRPELAQRSKLNMEKPVEDAPPVEYSVEADAQ